MALCIIGSTRFKAKEDNDYCVSNFTALLVCLGD